jgi:hypothetical protein
VASDDKKWFEARDLLSLIPMSRVSHGICPDCLPKLYPKTYDKMVREGKIAS